MEEERAWELFARAQGEMFEHVLDQVKGGSTQPLAFLLKLQRSLSLSLSLRGNSYLFIFRRA